MSTLPSIASLCRAALSTLPQCFVVAAVAVRDGIGLVVLMCCAVNVSVELSV